MATRETSALERKFDEAMFTIYRRAKAEARYTATIFLNMLNDRGGLATARYLINAEKPSDGIPRYGKEGSCT